MRLTNAALSETIRTALSEIGVIPVIAVNDPASAEPLAQTLWEAGLPIAEITFRTPVAGEVIARMRRTQPEMLIGAGTVISPEDVDSAVDAGAQFALAPGFVPETLARAHDRSLGFIPGIMTASDIGTSLNAGLAAMKFFPAVPAGGTTMLTALHAPHAHLHPQFVPTGGVKLETIPDWLSLDHVLAVGGTWIANPQLLGGQDWESIFENAKAAVAAARACAVQINS